MLQEASLLKDTIVFDGINTDVGRCVSFLGAIEALCRRDVIELRRLNRIGGAGAGAVTAVAVCSFASDPSRLCETIRDVFRGKYAKAPFVSSMGGVLRYLWTKTSCVSPPCDEGRAQGGAFDARSFWEGLGWTRATTFRDMHKRTGRHLRMVAVDLASHTTVYLDHIYTPDMPVLLALLACLGDPLHESPVVYNGREFVSAWSGSCIRKIFEEYNDESVVLSMMNSSRNGSHTRLTKMESGELETKRRSVDAVIDASRTDVVPKHRQHTSSSGRYGTFAQDTFRIYNVDPALSNSADDRYLWLYNAGFNAVMETEPVIM